MAKGCARCARLLRVIVKRHVEHHRTCGCLANASECCVTDCPCHALAALEAAAESV